ncbi:MAG: helix-turn-helix domain-containing protein [Pseudomonadales bacterium]|nr:helix-turn-helix domain-containing protein [Pseudomonadales bacterium]
MLSKRNILSVVYAITRHRDRPMSLKSLAGFVGWSQYYLQRSFRDHLGESPKQFQQRLCLDDAAIRLTQSDDSILDIAFATGHGSHEVFVRAFRRRFNCTPTAYRENARPKVSHADQDVHAKLVRELGPCVGLFQMSLNEPARSLNMPTSEITRTDLEARPILYIQRRVPHADLQQLFSECFPKLYGHCMQNGYEMAGNPIARYVDFTPGMVTVDCIIPLQKAAGGDGEIQMGELQSGPAAIATHSGPYDTLSETYGAIEKWIEENGYQRKGASWEWYVTDPGEVPDPKEWKTEVYFPIRP